MWRGGRAPLLLVVVVLAAIAGLVLLGVEAWQKSAFAWDVHLSEWIHAYENRHTVLDESVDVFSVVLDPVVQLFGPALLLVVLATAVLAGTCRTAVFVAIALCGALVVAPLLEILVQRPPVFDRTASGDSFPSSHATRTAVVWLALALVAWRTAWQWAAVVTGLTIVLLTGVGVVYHEWHWASDVLGSWLFALAWVTCAWIVVRPGAGSRATAVNPT